MTSGGHNGPTLFPVNANPVVWIPIAVGDSLEWSGTSNADLGSGELLFSTLQNVAGASLANFQVARDVSATVPEVGSLPLLGTVLLGLAVAGSLRKTLRTAR
jgi:hypothetical protein